MHSCAKESTAQNRSHSGTAAPLLMIKVTNDNCASSAKKTSCAK